MAPKFKVGNVVTYDEDDDAELEPGDIVHAFFSVGDDLDNPRYTLRAFYPLPLGDGRLGCRLVSANEKKYGEVICHPRAGESEHSYVVPATGENVVVLKYSR